MSYQCEILADSIGPHGIRLTTFEVTFPRFILAEVNTHRQLSRNSASSRAIPTEKQIAKVKSDPFVPEFNQRVTGMGVGEPLEGSAQRRAMWKWLEARDSAVKAAEGLLHVDKSRANRLLEPFMWHTAIISATEWDNFYGLRCHPDAQPEFQRIARMMQEAMWLSEPESVDYGTWHLPKVDPGSELAEARETQSESLWAEVSAGRCARVSYDTQNRDEHPWDDSQKRWRRLSGSGHWSPGEHPAQCVEVDTPDLGNYRGWKQLRKNYRYEDDFATLERMRAV